MRHSSLYAAFDRFPSRKGAGVHISRFAGTLFQVMGGGILYVLGDEALPAYQQEGNMEIIRFSQAVPNFLERTMAFGLRLGALLEESGDSLEICHFRDPWSGIPILSRPHSYKTIYEVNGLPSIELPYLYPSVSPQTLAKIRSLEDLCLRGSDVILVPSHAIRSSLAARGTPADRITVIPNGAEIPADAPRPEEAPAEYILYFGALQPWQGVDTLMRAFALLRDLENLRLVICASNHSRFVKGYSKLGEKIGIGDRILWRYSLSEEELAPWRQHALLSVAPLKECSRNLEQGCSPLKILESMASGIPVVASNLPSVREIILDREDGRLVHPDRPGEMARAIRILLQYPELRQQMGIKARQKIEREFTWSRAVERLADLYRVLSDQ